MVDPSPASYSYLGQLGYALLAVGAGGFGATLGYIVKHLLDKHDDHHDGGLTA